MKQIAECSDPSETQLSRSSTFTSSSVDKKTAFAKRMRKLKGSEAMATSLAAIAKSKEVALVPEGLRQLPPPPINAKVAPISSNYTNWNNFEFCPILSMMKMGSR